MSDKIDYQRWSPERFFYSHASKDKSLAEKIEKALRKINKDYEIYLAERKLVGQPLIEKLREELYNCNALIVGWTDNTYKKNTSQIISFEIGMAYSLGLPIYILRFTQRMPWFFDKVTDYLDISSNASKEIENELRKLEPFSFRHPIEILIPNEPYYKYNRSTNQSRNFEIVDENGLINFTKDFNGIIHFNLINRRHKPEKDVRLILKFPEQMNIVFDAGTLDGSTNVQRNEIFDMRQTSKGVVRMYWPSLPVELLKFEIRIQILELKTPLDSEIECAVSSDNIVGWRIKKFPVKINS